MIYGSWDINCKTYFFVILGHFLLFYPQQPKKWKYQNMKINPGYIIILHKCTTNHDHRLHCFWNMACDGSNYFSLWAIFCPFTPVTAWKMTIPQKFKKALKISPFHTSVPKMMIIYIIYSIYTVPKIWYDECNCYYLFWAIFYPFTPLTAQKMKIMPFYLPPLL